MKDENIRLKTEAEFQNARTKSDPFIGRRNKFYYLTNAAFKFYQKVLSENTLGKKIIVVGCAEGGVTPLAKAGAKNVLGVDIASEPVKRLNKKIEQEKLSDIALAIVGNAEDLDLPENSYDVICCLGVLHHLDIQKAALSWSRVLNNDGLVVMEEPMALNPIVALYRLLTPKMRTADEHPLVPADIKLLKKHFMKVDVQGYVFLSLFSLFFVYIYKSDELRDKSNRFLEKIDSLLLKRFKYLNYFCWTSVIVLREPCN
jgi:ubiquinone/menaquinone biosynthesis C-methylase UbiE